MQTLIELYDENPIENVLGTEMFRPKTTVLLCPQDEASGMKASLEKYFRYRKCNVRLVIVPVSLVDASKVEKRLREVLEQFDDCTIDISGGTDAALFAAGAVGGDTSVITYSRRKNSFFEIRNAAFARNCACTVKLDARSCFLMAGGTLLPGRGNSEELRGRINEIDRLFSVFRKFRKMWNRQISYMQRISSSEPGKLDAQGDRVIRSDQGTLTVNEELLHALDEAGLIRDLQVNDSEVRFTFPDETVRFWLRDIGAVLELAVFRTCLEAGCFDDVVLSAVVNWEGGRNQRNSVTNEIDVMAVRGIQPVFISCKTNEIRTEALNELAILRDRFGGKYARAMIVTSANATASRALSRMRASELNIEVIEWNDLLSGRLLKALMQEKR